MFDQCTSSRALGWRTVDNEYATKTLNDLCTDFLKPVKKIKRRTRILNRELTKFARLKSYSQYVKIKTKILKKLSNGSIEDELGSTSSSENEESPTQESLSLSDDEDATLSRTAYRKLPGGRSGTSKHVHKARHATRTAKKKLVGERSKASKHVQEATQVTRTANDKLVDKCSKTSKHVPVRTQTTRERKRACVKRNLMPLLDNVDTTNHLADRAITIAHPEDDDDKPNRDSSRETTMERTTVQITNVPTGDSGIDDDSQDNSSTNNRENDDAMELDDIAETSNRNDRRLEDSQTVDEAPNEAMMSDGEGSAYVAMEEEHKEEVDQGEEETEEIGEEERGKEELAEGEMEEEAIEEEKMENRVIEEEEKEELEIEEEKKKELEVGEKEKAEFEVEEKDEEKKEEEKKGKEKIKKEKKEDKDEEKIEEEEKEKEKEKAKKKKKEKNLKKEEKDEEKEVEKDEDTLHLDMNDELSKKKCQPIIKCTEIVTSKYMIIREEGDDVEDEEEEKGECTERSSLEHYIDHTLEESPESGGKSPESKRVNQLKRMNLFCSESESDSSECDENVEVTRNASWPSQLISEFSDSEYHSDSSSFHITDSDEPTAAQIPCRHDQEEEISRKTGSAAKSIKDQIEQQDIADSAMLLAGQNTGALGEKGNEEIDISKASCSRTSGNVGNDSSKDKRHGPSRAQSPHHTFKNIPETCFDEKEFAMCVDNTQDPLELTPNGDAGTSRPIELADFVTRHGLIPNCELSTITAKDIPPGSSEQENDENIWLMEVPRSIMTDPELCGKTMLIGNGNIKIGEVTYETTLRHDKNVSCILRSRRKKARYKTVNIKPVCSINIRHERAESESFRVTQAPPSPSSVPFPKNLKVRNPLTMKKKCRASSTKTTHRNDVEKKKKPQKTKKLKKGVWHMDHFISKSKKRRTDTS